MRRLTRWKILQKGERLWSSWKVCICRNEVSEEAGFPQGAAQHEPISYHFPLPDVICFEFANAERTPQTWKPVQDEITAHIPDKLPSSTQGLNGRCISNPHQKAEIIYALKYIQQNFSPAFLNYFQLFANPKILKKGIKVKRKKTEI